MILDKIDSRIIEKGFKKVKVNVENIYVYFMDMEQESYLLTVYRALNGQEYTKEQFSNIQNQIYKNFNKSEQELHFLTIIYTDTIENAREMSGMDNKVWYLDNKNKRLMIYENHRDNFLGLEKDIDNILYEINKDNLDFNEGSDADSKRPIRASYIFTITNLLILINALVFLIMETQGSTNDLYYMLDKGTLYWPAIEFNHEYYRFFTYMFLHFGIDHLVNNMLVLFVIGDKLERIVGKVKYLCIYFGSGLLAGIASLGYNMLKNNNIVSAGASGAIFGVVGAMAYVVLINKGRIREISSRQIVIFVLLSLYGGFTSQGIDNVAHIGGLFSGIILAAIFYKKHKMNFERG